MFNNQLFRVLFDPTIKIDKRTYRGGLIFLLFFVLLSTFFSFQYSIFDVLRQFNGYSFGKGFSGILKNLTDDYRSYSAILYLIPLRDILIVIVFVASITLSVKRCKALELPGWIGWIAGILTYMAYWALATYIVPAGSFFVFFSFDTWIWLCLLPGIAVVYFLLRDDAKDTKTADLFPIPKSLDIESFFKYFFWLVVVYFGIFILFDIIALFRVTIPVSVVTIKYAVFVFGFAFLLIKRIKSTSLNKRLVFGIFGVLIALEIVYMLLWTLDLESGRIAYLPEFSSFLSLMEYCAIVLTVVIIAQPDGDETGGIKTNFYINNRILRSLLDYRGTISNRGYLAGLSIVFLCVAAYNLAFNQICISSLFNNFINEGETSNLLNEFPLQHLYLAVIFYSTFVLTIKRGRALRMPVLIGGIIGAVIYMAFYMLKVLNQMILLNWSKLVARDPSLSLFRDLFSMWGYVIMFGLAIGAIVLLSQKLKNEMDDYNEDEDFSFYRMTSEVFLFKRMTLAIAMVAVVLTMVLIYKVSGSLSMMILRAFVVAILVFISMNVYYLLDRAKDAALHLWKIWIGVVLFIGLGIAFHFTQNNVYILIDHLILVLWFWVIFLPSANLEEENHASL
ncbi:hypothetical protein [Dysgonomonas sp. 520]|uniref:hypothetical protein n=1 Tax=Dysgonomonas sp. 520 TaxID=2302931 RepID=UPI0013CF9A61|nr:hypothetical protein [Dysgonomonas sp. 520]NDW09492.1 hypothetical protein [Dysgonomonas sp. 520]